MRILMQSWPSERPYTGGDSVQLINTKQALEELGVSVDIGAKPPRPLHEYDIVHLFNLIKPFTLIYMRQAKEAGIPIALSPIYWPSKEFLGKGISYTGNPALDSMMRAVSQLGLVKMPVHISRGLMSGKFDDPVSKELLLRGPFRVMKDILDSCDVVLPNSVAEADNLEKEFRVQREKMVVVPNAVSEIFFDERTTPYAPPQFGGHKFVLSVGRLEDRKNTLALIEACVSLGVPLMLVGWGDPKDRYYQACVKSARKGRILIGGSRPPESRDLCAVYRGAAAHALVSWYETPGLTNLEAAAAGTRIISSNRGSAPEYFGDDAIYADPVDVNSIRRAIQTAMSEQGAEAHIDALKARIRKDFNWKNAARKTLDGYEQALERS